MKNYRDLTFIDINKDEYMVISCDSCAGVGNKELDEIKVPLGIVSYFTTRVALMEIMSVKAKPIAIVDNLGVSMDDGGKAIIDGIKGFLNDINLDIPINGSTEENFKTLQTFLGTTAIGIMKKEELNHSVKSGSLVLSIGLPKVGNEIDINNDQEIISFYEFKKLLDLNYITSIIPVGSKGIKHECSIIEKITNMSINYNDIEIDLYKPAGPSTCVITTISEDYIDELKRNINCPIKILGKIS
ncbi:AIR synthase related protein [Tepidibacter aestuarii]|uniref:AIR synthase related protein n=1 Tax=Tepidibacter aestuarii TaxID=2925782 RepID=UPI0020BF781C|nr:AIR synthase related protein [Tepidibacter aestuarii]CAH2211835.1 Alpha-ribazole kinase [Tepidibacter aestuarii]